MRSLLLIISICIFQLFYYEFAFISYQFKKIIYNSNNDAGLPTPYHIRDSIFSLIDSLPEKDYTLVDFGSGQCDFIEEIGNKELKIKSIVGVELNKNDVELCKRKKMKNNIEIYNMDMVNYNFSNVLDILYMYEPLWCVNNKEAVSVYEKVIIKKPSYIIYISGVSPILNESFFKNMGYKTLSNSRVKRFLGWYGNYIYLFKKTN
jgi:hypothetical protein